MTETQILKKTVIDGGYCIGCGACASTPNSPFKIEFDNYAKLQAINTEDLATSTQASVLEVCPFSDSSKNEDELAGPLFADHSKKNDKIGYYLDTFAGHVTEGNYRSQGSSGGMGSWVLKELLEQDMIDKVIHIKETKQKPGTKVLFEYQISDSITQIQEGAKSRYYPIELSRILEILKTTPGRYAIVGIPCFIKTIRLLSLKDQILKDRIKFCIGLICGHLKSAHFASMFGWEMGVHPDNLNKIDFRTKLPDSSAIYYGVTVGEEVDGQQRDKVSPPVNQMYGSNWGWGLFKYKACDFCDDVLAETADLTIGDAWLQRYMEDPEGTNVVVVRNKELLKLLQNTRDKNKIALEALSIEEVIQSQRAGLSHRREGLAYRLQQADAKGEWRPKKRIQPSSDTLDEKKKKIQDLRITLRDKSHIAFQKAIAVGSFDSFKKLLASDIKRYQILYRPSFQKRVVIRLKQLTDKLIK